METINRNHISYQEMDGLIDLAEKVSENIEDLKSKIKKQQTQLILNGVLVALILLAMIYIIYYYPFVQFDSAIISTKKFNNLLFPSTLIFLSFLFFSTFTIFQEISKIRFSVNREQVVLQKLLNMIEGYKDFYVEDEYGNNKSVLSKALFEMRLSRINFKVK